MSPGGTASHAMDCAETRISLGVYVLGAIEPAERALVDAHLATCRDCRDELAGLAGLPALLARVATEEAIALAAADGPPASAPGAAEPPRELLATVLDLTAARRRRRRFREAAIGLVAALIIAAGVFGGLTMSAGTAPLASVAGGTNPGSPAGPWQTAAGHSGAMQATISYRSMGWGTQLETAVSGVPVGTRCQLWVTDSAGHQVAAGDWMTDGSEGIVWYPGSAALSADDITSFEVTVGSGRAIEVAA
jgi:Putative zinc-finger